MACKTLYTALIRRLYVDDIRSGHQHALSWACDAGVLPALERCLELGAPINDAFGDLSDYYKDNDLKVPSGHDDWLHFLKTRRATAHVQGLTPLLVAVAAGRLEAVRYLLEHGADPDESSIIEKRGGPPRSPLQWAVLALADDRDVPKGLRYEVLKTLLESGADPNARRCGGKHQLWGICRSGEWTGLEPSVRGYPYPLYLALEATRTDFECPPQAVDLLLQHGAQALAEGSPEEAPPGSAAWSRTLLKLFESCARQGSRYTYREYVYREASYAYAEKLNLVLQRFPGALAPHDWAEFLSTLADNPRLHTALMLKVALNAGYDPDVRYRRHGYRDKEGAIELVMRELKRAGGKSTGKYLGHPEVMDCALDMLRTLLEARTRPELDEESNHSGLGMAVIATAEADDDDDPRAMRHRRCVEAAIELFVRHGADLNAPYVMGETALHRICSWRNRPGRIFPPDGRSTFELLLRLGADVNKRDASGSTLLHTACGSDVNVSPTKPKRKKEYVVDAWLVGVLLQYGADMDARDADGQTPLDLLYAPGRPSHPEDLDAVKLLVRHRTNLRAARCREEGVEPNTKWGVEVDEDGVAPHC